MHFEFAPLFADALAHSGQADTNTPTILKAVERFAIHALSEITNAQHSACRFVLQRNLGTRAFRVAMDVGERLLQHAEQRKFHAPRQAAYVFGDVSGYLNSTALRESFQI